MHIIALMREHIYKTNSHHTLLIQGTLMPRTQNIQADQLKRPLGIRRQQSKAGPNLLH